MFYLDFAMTV